MTHTIPYEGRLYRYNDNAIGMFGRLSVKLPMPTHWMEGIQKSENGQERSKKYLMTPTEDEADELDDYNDVSLAIRKKTDDSTKPGSEPHLIAHIQWL
eukprot:1033094-Amphidinium_carterae.1